MSQRSGNFQIKLSCCARIIYLRITFLSGLVQSNSRKINVQPAMLVGAMASCSFHSLWLFLWSWDSLTVRGGLWGEVWNHSGRMLPLYCCLFVFWQQPPQIKTSSLQWGRPLLKVVSMLQGVVYVVPPVGTEKIRNGPKNTCTARFLWQCSSWLFLHGDVHHNLLLGVVHGSCDWDVPIAMCCWRCLAFSSSCESWQSARSQETKTLAARKSFCNIT